MIYGYVRVSTDGQSLDAQVKQLRAAGAQKVFRETASGAETGRPQLRRALSQLTEGDVLSVTRLDRLARSTRDLLNSKRCYYPTPSNFSFFSGGRFVVWRAGGLRPDRWHNACEAQRRQAQSYHRRLPLSYPFRPLEHRA